MPNVRQVGAVRFTRRETLEALRELSRDSGRPQTDVVHDLVTLFGPAYLRALAAADRTMVDVASRVTDFALPGDAAPRGLAAENV